MRALTQLAHRSRVNQAAIAREGGIPKLVNVLSSAVSNIKDVAAAELCSLAAAAVNEMCRGNAPNQAAFSSNEANAITPIVQMLGNPDPQMQASASGALSECMLLSTLSAC